jgi:hypothetical protein
MSQADLTVEELATLARFEKAPPHLNIDPDHFAKLISLGMLEQKLGGPGLTAAGQEQLARRRSAS